MEARVADEATLAAAAAIIAGPPPAARPLFSLVSEESLNISLDDLDGQAVALNSVDWNSTAYESLEMSSFQHSSYPAGPAILDVGPSETVNVAGGK